MSFEERLRAGLAGDAASVPGRRGDLEVVMRRGRRRRLAVAGAGVLGIAGFVMVSTIVVVGIFGTGSDPAVPATRATVPTTVPGTAISSTTTPPATVTPTTIPSPPPTTVPVVTTTVPNLPASTVPEVFASAFCTAAVVDGIGDDLTAWLLATNPGAGDDVAALVAEAWGLDGWVLAVAEFSRQFEPAVFAFDPAGDWHVAWGGLADSADLIRLSMAVELPGIPSGLLPCVDLARFLDAPQQMIIPPDLIDLAEHGRAMTVGFGSLWIATRQGPGPAGGTVIESGLILQVDRETSEIVASIDVGQPMHALQTGPDGIWMARRGDGALPDNLVGVLDPGTGGVQISDLGDFSVSGLAPVAGGAWITQGGGWPPAVMLLSTELDVIRRFDLAVPGSLGSLDVFGEDLYVTSATSEGGAVLRVDAVTGEVLETFLLPSFPVDIGVGADISDRAGVAVWVATGDGAVVVIGSGGVVAEYDANAPVCCLLSEPGSEQVWVVTEAGDLLVAAPGVPPLVMFTSATSAFAAATDGLSIWVVGESISWILLGQ